MSYKLQKSKTQSGLFDVNFYDSVSGKNIHEQKLQGISKDQIPYIDSYLQKHPSREISF